MTQNKITFEDLYASVTRPRYYGQKYYNADSEEKLLLVLGEACCVSAYSLVQTLKLPRRGRLVLNLIKSFFPQKYENHQFQYNFSFSHCLIYISRKLKEFLKRELTEKDADHISSTAYAYGGSYFGVIRKSSEEEKELLLREMEQRLYDYDKCKTIEEKVLLENILNGLGRKIPAKQVAIFFRETIEKDPLYLVEPFRFMERLKEFA